MDFGAEQLSKDETHFITTNNYLLKHSRKSPTSCKCSSTQPYIQLKFWFLLSYHIIQKIATENGH